MVATDFNVWRKIHIGMYQSLVEYLQALEGTDTRIKKDLSVDQFSFEGVSVSAKNLLLKVPFSNGKALRLNLALLSIQDLGFDEPTRYKEIFARGVERGLQLCPAEVGPALRLVYKDQPLLKSVVVAMKPVSSESEDVFTLKLSPYGVILSTVRHKLYYHHESQSRFKEQHFVFTLPEIE